MIRASAGGGGVMRKLLWAWRCSSSGRRRGRGAARRRPERNFTARDLFDLEAADDPADQPGRALDRLCPPLRRHHDRPLPPRDLADRHRHRPADAARRAAPASRAGRPTATASPISPPAEGGRAQLFVRWMASGQAVRDHRPARFAVERRLVAGRPPDRLCDVRARRGRAARPAPAAARGRGHGPSRCR